MATTNMEEIRIGLRKGLKEFYGSFKEVADRCEVSPSLVYKVLRGDRHNYDVLIMAKTVLDERKEKKERVEAIIQDARLSPAVAAY